MSVEHPVVFVTARELARAAEQTDGDSFTAAVGEDRAETNDAENSPGRPGQGTPGQEQVSNDNCESNSHKRTDGGRRTDLRSLEDHASWREIYRHCHVGEGHR